jgi:hypothetical protein
MLANHGRVWPETSNGEKNQTLVEQVHGIEWLVAEERERGPSEGSSHPGRRWGGRRFSFRRLRYAFQ